MLTKPFHVLVIGGGIGGLCLAQGLKKAGISVAVYERDRTPTARLQGYRIHINPHGSEALHFCLPPHLFEIFVLTCGKGGNDFSFYTEKMKELLSLEVVENEDMDPIKSHRSVSRITLRQVLLSGMDEIVHFNKKFIRYEKMADGKWKAIFEDGTSAIGDILVGADGGNSRVRKQFLPHADRIDTGIRAIAGKTPLTPETAALIPANTFSVIAPKGVGGFIAVQEFQDVKDDSIGSIGGNDKSYKAEPGLLFDNTTSYIMWTVVAKKEKYPIQVQQANARQLSGAELQDIALKMMKGWDPRYHQLVKMADAEATSLITFQSSFPIEHWETKNITLIGDAIHSMTPMRGIGGNTALRDAHILCQKLMEAHQGAKPILQAIHEYESEMIQYGFDAVRSSLKAAEQATAENAFGQAIMKTAFRTINAIPPLKHRIFHNFGND